MKYAITGHTQGIGLALFNTVENAIGFSTSNGYNINLKNDRKRIIDQSKECDIFINNAHSHYGQVDMLLDLFAAWKDQNKLVINIGSRIAEDTTCLKGYEHLLEYQIQKKALKVLHDDVVKLDAKLQFKYVWFGYVGTERILKKYPDMTPDQYISVETAVKIILS
jgi:hypothetical protein